jgi:vacuolar-type H+-ATPase subunit H
MEKTAILTKIKETEKKVGQSKKKALEQKDTIIKDSKKEALKILDQARAEAQSSYDEKVRQMRVEIETIRKRLLDEGEKKARTFKSRAELNSSLAVDMLIRKFEEEVR